ncbi:MULTISPECIES: DUF3147 family protein [Trichocoleus]|uniref:DUF3147 family protein n=1 Tax=Trichocoleus desertorum GB2-A4 TaxID=2933944 RepID=A0ABV0J3G0_9CYAN|nr:MULTISPECIES: DUF3147 family protein [unclassified Trichocoleus]MBD1860802.1 DUF3147 family protein [Trichocoleus sp. FACHB-46]MBD2097948.1 DUF3147 family protein [Trichocoleus sp. FACHB-591]MBD2123358.1 DUF3147 family protein [Trichocoleus sp. FACHB-262]
MSELILRFFIGGLFVSGFAVISDVLRPKSFAGLFGAAPSVALATLSIAFANNGMTYVQTAAQAMIAGAIALFFYSLLVTWLLLSQRIKAWVAAVAAWLLWLTVAYGLWTVSFT